MNRLKELRRERGLTLKKLSEQIGIPVPTLSNYENSNREAKADTWLRFAEFFEVDVPYLQGLPLTRWLYCPHCGKRQHFENDLEDLQGIVRCENCKESFRYSISFMYESEKI